MSSLPWARVKPVLEQALAAAPEEREAVITAACGDDAELRREVEAYLRFEQSAQSLRWPTRWGGAESEQDWPAPTRVGPWRVVREIGRGGMGIVYLAERDDGEYHQTAALKLARESHRSEAFVDLFRRERQTLAQLSHPNIGRMLDGGTTPEGRPYFAMEYVDGMPLDEYCRAHRLSVEATLQLFLLICRAVSHAHRHLFIHRDLKPNNILVTEAGEAKLLDFGLAKLLDPETDSQITMSGMPLYTPAYASPEQLRGEELTTASDVYSLGVILYELLAGCSPYGAARRGVSEILAALNAGAPRAPSIVAAPRERYRNAADLDSIVLLALRQEPEQRYPGADALADDLERYLSGKPVRARQGKASYYVRRWVVRHRWAFSAALIVLLGGSIAAGALVWEYRQSEWRFQQLRRFARSVVFEIHDSVEALPGSTATRKLLVQRSLEYLRSLEASKAHDAGLQWELAEAYKRIGDAQGNPARANLGDSAGALDSYSHARGLLRQIADAEPANMAALNSLAALDRTSADIASDLGRPAESLALRQEAIQALGQVAAHGPTLAARKALALSHYNLAVGLSQASDWPRATREWHETLRLFRDIADSRPADAALRRNVALCEKRLASVYLQHDESAQAMAHYAEAERIDRARLAAERDSGEAKMDLSFDLSDTGLALRRAHRAEEAVRCLEEAVQLRRAVVATDRSDYRAQMALGAGLDRLAGAYAEAGHLDRAIEASRTATLTLAPVHDHDPLNRVIGRESGLAFIRLGKLCRERANRPGAARTARDWLAALTAFEHGGALLHGMDNATELAAKERDDLAALPAMEAECRSHLKLHP